MKKFTFQTFGKFILLIMMIFSIGQLKAQNGYNCTIDSIQLISPTELTFDIMVKNTGTTNLGLQTFQLGIEFDYDAMAAGGTITSSWVPGSSTALLPSGFQDLSAQGAVAMGVPLSGSNYRQIRLTAKTGVGAAIAIPIPATYARYARLKLTNTVPFPSCVAPNFIWSFVNTTGRTRTAISAFVNQATTGTPLTSQTTGGTPNAAAGNTASPYSYIGGPQHFVESNLPLLPCGTCPSQATAGSIVDPLCYGGTGSAVITLDVAAAGGGDYSVNGGTAVPFAAGLSFSVAGLPQGSNTIVINAINCTTPVTVNVLIGGPLAPIVNTTTATACDTYTWASNTQAYTTSGNYANVYTDVNGCTVTDSLYLTINNSTSNTTNVTACDSYTWSLNSQTYTVTGTYSESSTNAAGCTHTEILNLTINNSTSNTTNATACDSYTWSVNSQTYTVTGTYSESSTNAAGCVHTETLNLTINNSTSNSTTVTACDSYTWSVNSQTYTVTGIYTDVSTNASGCAHTETLDLTITPSTSSSTSASACDTYTWSINGQTYTASGTYTNVVGCHTDTLNLTITPSSNVNTTVTACDTYTWMTNGQTYTTSGVYTYTANCVTETLNLTINASSSQSSTATACGTYTWSVDGQTYTASGIYTAVVNCVTYTLDLTINPTTNNTTTASACGSYTWSVDGQTYTTSGTYTSTTGCNVETLILTILTTQGTTTTANTCGGSYTWALNGQTYTASGTYTYTTGCAVNTLILNITGSAVINGLNVTNVTGISAWVNWTAVAGIGWYEARWKPINSNTWIVGTNNTSITKVIVNLIPNTVYHVQVRGFCSMTSVGAWSNLVQFTTGTVCGTPTNVTGVSQVGNQCLVTWANVPGAGFYNLRYKVLPTGSWVNVSNVTNPKTLNGLIPNTNYEVQVAAGCNGGNAISPWSASAFFTTAPACGMPINLNATNITASTAKLNWSATFSTTYYSTRYKKVTSSTWINGSSTGNSKNIAGLQAGQNYEFQVRSTCTGNVNGLWSPSAFFSTSTIREAIDEEATEMDMTVYPNPTQNELNVEFTVTEFTQTMLKLIDMSGRVVKQVQLSAYEGSNKATINVSDLANGIYTLQVIGNDQLMKVTRITKN